MLNLLKPIVLLSYFVPKCSHGSEYYSFPMTDRANGIAYRTCSKCGERRAYDFEQMRFMSEREHESAQLEANAERCLQPLRRIPRENAVRTTGPAVLV